jgi:cell division septal protein FtsQ
VIEIRRDNSRSVVRDALRARRRKKTRRVLVSYLGALVVLYAGAWHLAHHPSFAVERIDVDGNSVSSDEALSAAAISALDSPTLSLMPMTNAYLTRPARIEEALEAEFPEIGTATVARVGTALDVTVVERERFGYWCRGEGDCFALDGQGVIFASSTPAAGATRFEGLVAAQNPIRERYAPAEVWGNLRAVLDALRARGYAPTSVKSQDGVDFTVALAEGPTVLLDGTHSGAIAIENLQIALDDEALASLRSYEYADLRLPHKVFLKALAE